MSLSKKFKQKENFLVQVTKWHKNSPLGPQDMPPASLSPHCDLSSVLQLLESLSYLGTFAHDALPGS